MRKDVYFDSCGRGKIHVCRWEPEGTPTAVFQIVHGIAEHVVRYDDFAHYLNSFGYLVVAEDHMGHGSSIGKDGIQGYFHGGWFNAVEDTYHLLQETRKEYQGIPYVLFGHSMGSFIVRTILSKYPDSGITACIICGTGWQPGAILSAGLQICKGVCKLTNETKPNRMLQSLVFGSYNKRVERPRTPYDWLSRDSRKVDAYIADPLCGFTASAGLLRDMLIGISYIQRAENLNNMTKSLPVLFIAGGDDPVGAYGDGVRKTADMFIAVGMEHVTTRIYALCRHEILNEINKSNIYHDIMQWLNTVTED